MQQAKWVAIALGLGFVLVILGWFFGWATTVKSPSDGNTYYMRVLTPADGGDTRLPLNLERDCEDVGDGDYICFDASIGAREREQAVREERARRASDSP